MRRTDPLIVGGGPAGAAAAIALARAGARPLLLERTREAHDVVCGAFVGWDALEALRAIGIDPWALGAHPIARVRVCAATHVVERALPHRAAGLSRRALDAALLAHATEAGVAVERGVAVRRVEGHMLHLADGAMLEADALFLATGKHALRGSPRDGTAQGWVGLRATIAAAPDLAGCIELHLLDRGYAGILVQEDGRANLCLSIAPERLAAAGSAERLVALLAMEAPRLAARLDGAGGWTAIAGVPYGWRARSTAPGLFRVGDQAAVIASLAGDGIAIALASGRAAAAAWMAGGAAAAPDYQRHFARRARRPIGIAEVLRHAAERPRLAALLVGGPARLPRALAAAAALTRIGP